MFPQVRSRFHGVLQSDSRYPEGAQNGPGIAELDTLAGASPTLTRSAS